MDMNSMVNGVMSAVNYTSAIAASAITASINAELKSNLIAAGLSDAGPKNDGTTNWFGVYQGTRYTLQTKLAPVGDPARNAPYQNSTAITGSVYFNGAEGVISVVASGLWFAFDVAAG